MEDTKLSPAKRKVAKRGGASKYYESFRENTTCKEIMDILVLYGECSQDQLNRFIKKAEDTIRKSISRLESDGYVLTKKAYGKKIVRLSKSSKDHYGIKDVQTNVTSEQRLTRNARATEVKMAFKLSEPSNRPSYKDAFEDIKMIKGEHPDLSLKLSRIYGVYTHGNKHYAVFNIGSGITWRTSNEQNARTWLRDRYLHESLSAAMLLVNDMDSVSRMFLLNNDKQKLSPANTIYNEMIVYPLTPEGHEELKLYRSLESPHEQFVRAVFNDDEINKYSNELYDGTWKASNPKNAPTVVLFDCDIMRVYSIMELARLNTVSAIYIACYDTQEEFFKEIFEDYPQVEIVAFSFRDAVQRLLKP